jgi:hypothetical protein
MQHSSRYSFIKNVELNLKKKLVNCYIWIKALCGAANWALPKVDHNCLECLEMWCCRRIELIGWTDRLKYKEVLKRIAENKDNLHTIKQKKPNWKMHQFTTLNQQNANIFFLNIYVQISTEYL